MRSRYFTREDNKWRIKPGIQGMVKWGLINLADELQRNSVPVQNIIFCRNVFIYFHEELIRKIVQDFHAKLSSPGYLFTGISESLYRIKNGFELVELGKTFLYKKS
jgi:chemotaxis protein methyltransferase CheR